MTAPSKQIEVTLDSVIESVDLAESITVRVAEAVGFDDDARHKLGMSVREGVINALQYGNKMQPEKKIYLTLALQHDRFEIRVLDEGPGFDLASVPDPLADENILKCSGRGILLMRSFMDEFNVVRAPQGGAEVIMALHYPEAGNGNPRRGSRHKEE
jgi:serine/threonine-protein kinase RsbW